GSIGRLEGTDPSIALNVVADVTRLDDVAGGKSGAANHVFHPLGDQLLVADAVLHRADGAAFFEQMGSLRDGDFGVRSLGGDNAVIAARQFFGIAGGAQARGEIGGAGE